MRTCSKCGRRLPVDAFPVRNNRRSGRQSYCRACQHRPVNELGKANRAEAAAVHELKERHWDEYEALLDRARAEVGFP